MWNKHYLAHMFAALHGTECLFRLREVHDSEWLQRLDHPLPVVSHDVFHHSGSERGGVEDTPHVDSRKRSVAQEGRHIQPGVPDCKICQYSCITQFVSMEKTYTYPAGPAR